MGDKLLSCTFCTKDQQRVEKLVAGPGIYICNECVRLCQDFMDLPSDRGKVDPVAHFKAMDNETLLQGIADVERVRREVVEQQQLVIDILRHREVTWARIGESLGVSRQAVWRRFGGEY